MEGGWRVDGGRMEGGWRVDGGRMEGGWRVDGGRMEGGWRADGGRMEGGGSLEVRSAHKRAGKPRVEACKGYPCTRNGTGTIGDALFNKTLITTTTT